MDPNQELEGKGGVGEGTPISEGAIGEGAPTATGGQPIAGQGQEAAKVNLTDLAEFRAYQANVDREKEAARRREQALQQQLQSVQAQQAAMMREFEALQLKGVKPEQAVGYLQQQLAKERQERETEARQQAAARELQTRAEQTLASLGMDLDTPGLDLTGGATEEGYRLLLESALQIAGKRTGEEAARLKAQAEEAARQAAQTTQVEMARQMGATTVSTTTGPGAPATDFFQGEKDPAKRLSMALHASRKK